MRFLKSQKYRRIAGRREKDFFLFNLSDRILIKTLSKLPVTISHPHLPCLPSVPLVPPFPIQTSSPVPCNHDLPSLCNVLHMFSWRGNKSHNAISTFQNVPHCAYEFKGQPNVALDRKSCTTAAKLPFLISGIFILVMPAVCIAGLQNTF